MGHHSRRPAGPIQLAAVLAATVALVGGFTVGAHAPRLVSDSAAAQSLTSGELLDVDAVAPDDVWAVGDTAPPSGSPTKPLVAHWDGTTWSRVAVANPGGQQDTRLTSVSAPGPSDVWVVGNYRTGGELDRPVPFAEHWNGTSWRVDKLPVPQTGFDSYAEAFSVVALSSHNVWVVGYASSIDSEVGTFAYIVHWDGTVWALSQIDRPDGCCDGKWLGGVSAIPGGALYAVGKVDPAGPLVEHRRGQKWFKQASPRIPDGELNGVASFAVGDAWAVGGYPSSYWRTLALHWNGTRWTRVATPNPAGAANSNEFAAVGGAGPDDIWAVGYLTRSSWAQPMTEHWDGTAWSVVDIGAPGLGSVLNGVTATSPTDAWAVGHSYDGTTVSALIEHWDGTAWTVVAPA